MCVLCVCVGVCVCVCVGVCGVCVFVCVCVDRWISSCTNCIETRVSGLLIEVSRYASLITVLLYTYLLMYCHTQALQVIVSYETIYENPSN